MTNSRLQQLLNGLSQIDTVEAKKELLIALGDEKDGSVYPVLLKHLEDPDQDIQYAAVVALGRYGNTSAVTEIVKAKVFRSASAKVRRAAVNAAGQLGDVRVIEHLVRATEDEEWLVRDQAIGELKKKVQRMIEGGDSRSDKILLHMLSLKDPELVQMAVEGLVIQGEKGLEFLIQSLKSTLPLIRENTAKALGLSKNANAVPPLMNLLQDAVSSVRKSAVEALGRLRDKRAIDSLVVALKDNVPEVQRQASAALVDFGLLSTEPLLQALTYERNKFVIRSVILTLDEIRDPRSIPVLIHMIQNPYFLVRSAAVDALVQPYAGVRIDKVAGIEARGFILGGAVAHQLSTGFVPVRKKGKLPFDVIGEEYDLEYGKDRVEIHTDAVKKGEHIVLVDDLIATGGTAFASIKLLERAGAKVVGCVFVIDLPELGGADKIRALGKEVTTLVAFAGH